MNIQRNFPRVILILALAFMVPATALLTGCGKESTAPEITLEQAPTLPDPAGLAVNLDFFADGAKSAEKFGRQNFYNAYLRAVIIGAMTDLVLTPPVAAFSLALHTVPSHQPDGSWLWVYTFVNGSEEAQVRLRGAVMTDRVDWQMRVTLVDAHHNLNQALWFEGYTQNDGADGHWTFYDLDQSSLPAAAELEWHHGAARHELRLKALLGDDAGDELTFRVDGVEHRIDFADGASPDLWFIRWNESDRTGSLQVPDYRNGEEACWDAQQYDTVCVP